MAARFCDTSATKVTLPFVEEQIAAAKRLTGEDFWLYGVAANRHVLEAFLLAPHRQGLSARKLTGGRVVPGLDARCLGDLSRDTRRRSCWSRPASAKGRWRAARWSMLADFGCGIKAVRGKREWEAPSGEGPCYRSANL